MRNLLCLSVRQSQHGWLQPITSDGAALAINIEKDLFLIKIITIIVSLTGRPESPTPMAVYLLVKREVERRRARSEADKREL